MSEEIPSYKSKPFPPPPVMPTPQHSPLPTPQLALPPIPPMTVEHMDKGGDAGMQMLTSDEVQFILRRTLRPDQINNPRVLKFIASYLECRNSRQAAVNAGYSGQQGYHLRQRPEIHAAIGAITAKSMEKYGYDAEEIVRRVKEVSDFDPLDIFNLDGTCKESMADIPPEARRAIKSFEVKNLWGTDPNGMKTVVGRLVKVEILDKMKAHEMLAREKKVMKDTKVVQHDITNNMKDTLLESQRIAEARSVPALIEGATEVEIDES